VVCTVVVAMLATIGKVLSPVPVAPAAGPGSVIEHSIDVNETDGRRAATEKERRAADTEDPDTGTTDRSDDREQEGRHPDPADPTDPIDEDADGDGDAQPTDGHGTADQTGDMPQSDGEQQSDGAQERRGASGWLERILWPVLDGLDALEGLDGRVDNAGSAEPATD